MDKDRARGASKKVGGKIKETIGKVTGDKKLQDQGVVEQGEGKVQDKFGEVKDKTRERP